MGEVEVESVLRRPSSFDAVDDDLFDFELGLWAISELSVRSTFLGGEDSYGLKAGDRLEGSVVVVGVLSFLSSFFLSDEELVLVESAPICEQVCANSARGDFFASI